MYTIYLNYHCIKKYSIIRWHIFFLRDGFK
jgi:hypothetical protein